MGSYQIDSGKICDKINTHLWQTFSKPGIEWNSLNSKSMYRRPAGDKAFGEILNAFPLRVQRTR